MEAFNPMGTPTGNRRAEGDGWRRGGGGGLRKFDGGMLEHLCTPGWPGTNQLWAFPGSPTLLNRWLLSFSPNPLLWPLLRSGNKRQSTPSGAPAPAYPLCSQVLSERRPNTGILGLLLHRDNDNGNAHIADAILDSSEEDCVQLVSCPRIPRSQPLVNLCLFPHVKRQSSFSGSEMLEPSSRAWFRHQRGLTQWSRDLKSRPSACMPTGGYFEKENGAGKKSASASGNVWGHLRISF